MVGWHHLLSGQLAQFEQVPGVGDGQGSLVCCSPWGRKQTQLSDSTELIQFSWVFNTLCGPGVSCSGSRAFVSSFLWHLRLVTREMVCLMLRSW